MRFADLRATFINAVFLRRISRELKLTTSALDRANRLKEFELSCRYPEKFKQLKAQDARGSTARRPLEMSVANPAEWDTAWREAHPTADEDDDLLN